MVKKRKDRPRPSYLVVSGSVRGSSHRRKGTPNQDSVCGPAEGGGDAVAVAVADGHGSPLYVRSDFGSGAATVGACEVLESVVTSEYSGGNPSALVAETIRTRIPSTIHSDWVGRVEAHLLEQPFTPFELGALTTAQQDKLHRKPVTAYGCTLLAAALGERFGMLARIGDGAVRVMDAAGQLHAPFAEEADNGSEATESLCMQDAASRLDTRYLNFESGVPLCIGLATDGYTKAFRDPQGIDRGFKQIYEHLCKHGVEEFERGLTRLLEETTASSTGDDISIALVVRSDRVPEASTQQQRRFL